MSELATLLRERLDGDVRFDPMTRRLYSTDASIYQMEPIGVVLPRHEEDVQRAVETAVSRSAPVLPRGGGTSLAGQAVGEALILDFSRHMASILELNREERWVRVQPGIVRDRLGSALKPHGLVFGPETSTSNRANIGGMIGNNSAGARSLVYGKTVENVLEVSAILADGTRAVFGPMDRELATAKARGKDLEARIYAEALALAEEFRDTITSRYPAIPRRVSGYNLDELLDPSTINLAKLIVGSEGTLASVIEAKLQLAVAPRETGLAVLHFDGMLPALETGCEILELEPSAVELIDKMVMDLARQSLEYSRRMGFVQGEPDSLILVEFNGETRTELDHKFDRLEKLLGSRGAPMLRMFEPADQANVWKLRKAALPLLLGLPGDHKPIAFVEDTAVTPQELPEFIRRFEEILAGSDTVGSFYAHAGAGCLHVRPLVNLKDGLEVQKMHRIAEEIFELVVEFKGSMSGEHGDGLAGSHFNRRLFGDEIYGAFRRLKAAFDPDGLMNPGKVVDAPSMTENLRYGARYRTLPIATVYPYEREGGFARAVELCNGAGVCRKTQEGTMCPPFMVTGDEAHSTRGRANALRSVLDGSLPPEEMHGERLYEVMDLCISCKGCKAECPSNVDLARLKSEFLHQYHRHHRRSLRDRMVTGVEAMGRLGRAFAPVSNWLLANPASRRLMEAVVGIDARRSLTPFAVQGFRQWFRERERDPAATGERGQVVFFDDTFMEFHEPSIGRAATRLLERSGFEVILARPACCGRPHLSKGDLDAARELATRNVEALAPFAEAGIPIVGCEPSCLLSLRDEYPDLLAASESLSEKARRVASRSVLLEEFFAEQELPIPVRQSPARILVHGHCHLKALVGMEPTLAFLGKLGAPVEVIDSGCCGMAGSFGYEKEHFDLSMAMAERRLLGAVRAADPETLVVAPGTSCRHQIKDGASRRALHPAEAAAAACGLSF